MCQVYRSMSAKSAAPARRSPLLALWSRDDPRTAVIDFLQTKTIAVLPIVAKPLRDAQSRLLITAIKRRAKTTVPNPPTTRACLDALLVGEPQFFYENWERGYSPQWRLVCQEGAQLAWQSSVKRSRDGEYFLELGGPSVSHRGFVRSLRAENLLVRRLRVTMSWCGMSCYYDVPDDASGAVGYVMLCGPGAPRDPNDANHTLDHFMGGLRFKMGATGGVSLTWLEYIQSGDTAERILAERVPGGTRYVVDATFQHESVTSCSGTVDISVNGQMAAEGIPIVYSPLSSIHLYNWSPGLSRIGGIEIWSEKAVPNQVWHG